jgi:hypothetical protein
MNNETAGGSVSSGEDKPAAGGGTAQRPLGIPQRINKGNLLLAGLFVTGMVCIYMLRLQGGPSQASAEQSKTQEQVDNVLARITASKGTSQLAAEKYKDVINTFYYEAQNRQIPLSALGGNPFVFTRGGAVTQAGRSAPATGQEAGPTESEPQEYAQALKEIKKLSLQTILTGSSGSAAMISNNLLAEGQMICGWTVTKIRSNEVMFTWKDKTYVLGLP